SGDYSVINELIGAETQFDPHEFAERVLADSPLFKGFLSVSDPTRAGYLRHLRHLVRLQCRFTDGHGRLDFVRDLARLEVLEVEDIAGYDLPSLAGTGLKRLALTGPPLPDSVDLTPLADTRGLVSVEARPATTGWAAL